MGSEHPGGLRAAFPLRAPSIMKKKAIKVSVNTAEGPLHKPLKYQPLTTVLYRTTQGKTPLKQNPPAGSSTAEPGLRDRAGVSPTLRMPKAFPTPLLNAATLRHVRRRTTAEAAQLCTVTHLLSARKEEFRLSHTTWYFVFPSDAAHPSHDPASPRSLRSISQAYRGTGQRCTSKEG